MLRMSSIVRSDVVCTSTSSLVQLVNTKRTTRTIRTVVRGLGKPLTEFRPERITPRFLSTRPSTRIPAFGRKPVQRSPQVAQVDEEEHSSVPTSEVQVSEERLGSNIPWGKGKIVEVMVLWFCAFVLLKSSIWKLGMWVLGIASESELSASGQAAFTLGLDCSMLGATIFILQRCLEKYGPLKGKGIFPFKTKGKWWIILLLSIPCIPIVDWLGTRMTVWFPEELDLSTNNVVVQLSRGDFLPNLLYFILLSLCAPVWEELMFRGFLLPSLGKFLPSALAILASSAIFALMHGNMRQFLPLWVLGNIIGNAFVRANNLLPAILLHSVYNSYVFIRVLMGC